MEQNKTSIRLRKVQLKMEITNIKSKRCKTCNKKLHRTNKSGKCRKHRQEKHTPKSLQPLRTLNRGKHKITLKKLIQAHKEIEIDCKHLKYCDNCRFQITCDILTTVHDRMIYKNLKQSQRKKQKNK